MKKFFRNGIVIIFFLQTIFCFAEPQQEIIITEISPKKIEEEEEWFEFSISGNDLIDISNWKISNTNSTKNIIEKIFSLKVGSSGEINNNFSGSGLAVKIAPDQIILPTKEENKIFFFFSPSPVSLPDTGGKLQILDDKNNIKDEVLFPAVKSGVLGEFPYTDIWNRSFTIPPLFPLRYHWKNPQYPHTKGEENLLLPTHPDQIKLLISEVSPKRTSGDGNDFIELFVEEAPKEGANLKYLEIKHNGTSLIKIHNDLFVKQGDFILLWFNTTSPQIIKNIPPYELSTDELTGASSGSGTIEVILFSGTSFESEEDFLCYKDTKLSQTEENRVQKKIISGAWGGECYEIQNLIENESIGRNEGGGDTNTKEDFFRHFNGTPGKENREQNTPPTAKIVIQGSKRIYKTSLNMTGEESIDPDGKKDLKSFFWTINNEHCPQESSGWKWLGLCEEESQKQNPGNIHFEKIGKYVIELTVQDYSGGIGKDMVEIEVTEYGIDPFGVGGGGNAFDKSLKKWLEREIQKEGENKEGMDYAEREFFFDFIQSIDWENIREIPSPPREEDLQIKNEKKLYARDKFTDTERKRLAKNIGFIFLKP